MRRSSWKRLTILCLMALSIWVYYTRLLEYRISPVRVSPDLLLDPTTRYRGLKAVAEFANASREAFNDPLPMDFTLAERLAVWDMAPMMDPPDAVAWNVEACELCPRNHNKDLISKYSMYWAAMNMSTIYKTRTKMIDFLREQQEQGVMDPENPRNLLGEGRGIIFTAGNADTIERVRITLIMLRHHYKCHLPVEIFYYKGEEPSEKNIKVFAEWNAVFRGMDISKDKTRIKNYQVKSSALVQTSFQQVLYLDSDNIPSRDPEYIFDTAVFNRTGIMLWPDYWKTSANNPIWQILGIQARDMWETEAGQIYVDKAKHLDALLLADYMNRDWKFWYMFSDGDKDTFPFSFLALRKRWAVPGRWVGAAGMPKGTLSGEFCAHTMVQHDHLGDPLFVHANLLKQIASGIGRGYCWGRTKMLPSYPSPKLPHVEAQRPKGVIYEGEQGNLDIDHLTNADFLGNALKPASGEVRRRAALEKAIKAYFHGGAVSALCIDLAFEDPRPEAETGKKRIADDWDWVYPLSIFVWKDDAIMSQVEDRLFDLEFQPLGKGFS